MQKMLDELKQQFDLTVERELLAIKEANSLREELTLARETMASERASHQQEIAQLKERAETMAAKAEREEGMRMELEKLLQRQQHEWDLSRAALEQDVKLLESEMGSLRKRELTLQQNLQQTLTEARALREDLLQTQATLQERTSQLEDSRRHEERAVETAKTFEEELDKMCKRWWEENAQAREREMALTDEQFQAKLALAQEAGANRELAYNVEDARKQASDERARSMHYESWGRHHGFPLHPHHFIHHQPAPSCTAPASHPEPNRESLTEIEHVYHRRLREIDQRYSTSLDQPFSEEQKQDEFKARYPLLSAEILHR
eukprot:TRINITY_DN24488_c0_g1_i2.p1 TRINITY_DN24488_c0_g1~~TRINITY_DN24488_c0_g1_i2.p1  ORF type:complete len:319 (+),score=90.02 TRINITY_DN24488_c0_g1_i2:226-1182(+)